MAASDIEGTTKREANRLAFPRGRHPSLGTFLEQTATQATAHQLPAFAGNLAFRGLLAIAASLLALVWLLRALHQPWLLDTGLFLASAALPGAATGVIRTQLANPPLPQASGSFSLAVLASLLVALWTLIETFQGTMQALNTIYGLHEHRPLWRRYLVCLFGSLGTGTLLVGAMVLVGKGTAIATTLAHRLGLGAVAGAAWVVIAWPAMVAVVLLAFALAYWWGPDCRQPFRWIRTGSVLAAGLWALFAGVYTWYTNHVMASTQLYGVLAGVVILLLYLYGCSYILLLGAEMNQVIEAHALPCEGTTSADAPSPSSPR